MTIKYTYSSLSFLTFWGLAITTISIKAMDLRPQQNPEVRHISTSTIDGKQINKKNFLDEDGSIKSRTFLQSLLKNAASENSLPREFALVTTDSIKSLSGEQKTAIWGTNQLFLVTLPNHYSFIIKGMSKWEEEIKNLTNATKIRSLRKYWYPHQDNKFPQLIFPIAYLSYTDQEEKEHYLSIMPTAPGTSLEKLFKQFADNPKDRTLMKTIAQAYFDVGAAMAHFYGDTNKKITQGDLHQGNIFYEPEQRRVTLIDNERIATGNPLGTCEDICFLLLKSLYVMEWTKTGLIEKLQGKGELGSWYSLYLPNFIAGYLSTFKNGFIGNLLNRSELEEQFNSLKECIINYNDPQKNNRNWYSSERDLGFSHKSYIEPILKALKSSSILFKLDDLHQKNGENKTLLHQAALRGEKFMIWPLISAGLDVNARDIHGNTPLHEASYYNHVDTIKALVRAGADIKAKTKKEETPLDKAKFNNSTNAIKTLEDYLSR